MQFTMNWNQPLPDRGGLLMLAVTNWLAVAQLMTQGQFNWQLCCSTEAQSHERCTTCVSITSKSWTKSQSFLQVLPKSLELFQNLVQRTYDWMFFHVTHIRFRSRCASRAMSACVRPERSDPSFFRYRRLASLNAMESLRSA